MTVNTSKPFLIGIDPAFRKSGFCVCVISPDKTVKFEVFKNGFIDFIKWLEFLTEDVIVAVENSNLQNVTFDTKGTPAVQRRKSRNAGANMAISQCTYDLCVHRFGAQKVIEISPLMKGVKWSEKTFSRTVLSENHELINYGKGSQDKRDAYKLALQAWQFRGRLKSVPFSKQ